jgi:hypothetical protein
VAVVVALLADGRADPAVHGSVVLCRAADSGCTALVKALLADGRADPAASGSRALIGAAVYRRMEVVGALLDDGRADPAAGGGIAVRQAVATSHVAAVTALLADGRANSDEMNRRAVLLAGVLNSAEAEQARGLQPLWQCLQQWVWWRRRRLWLRACR